MSEDFARFFGAPFVSVAPDELFPRLLDKSSARLLFFADQFALRRAVFVPSLRRLWRESGVVVAVSTLAAQRRARLATGKLFTVLSEFQTVVRLLDLLEPRRGSVYVLGPTAEALFVVEQNLRATFPKVHVVGRSVVNAQIVENTLTAIVKAAPTVVLVGPLRAQGRRWVQSRFRDFGPALVLYAPDAFRRMAHRRRSTIGKRLIGILLWPILMVAMLGNRLLVITRTRRAGRTE